MKTEKIWHTKWQVGCFTRIRFSVNVLPFPCLPQKGHSLKRSVHLLLTTLTLIHTRLTAAWQTTLSATLSNAVLCFFSSHPSACSHWIFLTYWRNMDMDIGIPWLVTFSLKPYPDVSSQTEISFIKKAHSQCLFSAHHRFWLALTCVFVVPQVPWAQS